MSPVPVSQSSSDARPSDDLPRLSAARLRALIRERVAGPRPPADPVEDWRIGSVPPEMRAELRRYFPSEPRRAAVLVPIVDHAAALAVLLTERSSALRQHAGQISFPGGGIERDETVVDAALREAEEEIGLSRDLVEVVGTLPDHLIVSGFRVTPVVAFVRPDYSLRLDRQEVADAFEVPLPFLLDPANHVRRLRRFENHEVELTDLPWGDRNIWGATAGMLLTFYRVLRGEDA